MPNYPKLVKDAGLLEAALEGLELQKQRVEAQIREVRSLLGRKRGPVPSAGESQPAAPAKPRKKRQLSEAARKRIAAAQKKRWAEYRKSSGAES
jgi:hypothetical protein